MEEEQLPGRLADTGTSYVNYSYGITTQGDNVVGKMYTGTTTGCDNFTTTIIIKWNDTIITSKLTNNFCKDEKGINNGFPILEWQVNGF